MGWWHHTSGGRSQPGHPSVGDSLTPLGSDMLQEQLPGAQGYQEGTVTHPRRPWQGVSSGVGDKGSAAGCRLAQEGSTRIQTLGSDLPSHSSPEFWGNGPTPPPSRAITRPGTPGLTPTGRHLHPCGPEPAEVGGRSPKGSRAAGPMGAITLT